MPEVDLLVLVDKSGAAAFDERPSPRLFDLKAP
jgi:hypothetical protein